MTQADELNDAERRARDLIKGVLGGRGTVTAIKQVGDEITIEVVSPSHFNTAANQLSEVGSRIAQETNCAIHLKLHTSWPAGPRQPSFKG